MTKACRFRLTLIGHSATTLSYVVVLSILALAVAGCNSEPMNSTTKYIDLTDHYFTTNGVPISIEVGTYRLGEISSEMFMVASSPQQLLGDEGNDDDEGNDEDGDSASTDDEYKKVVFFVISTKPVEQPNKGRKPELDFRVRFTESQSNYVKLPTDPAMYPRRLAYRVICPGRNVSPLPDPGSYIIAAVVVDGDDTPVLQPLTTADDEVGPTPAQKIAMFKFEHKSQ